VLGSPKMGGGVLIATSIQNSGLPKDRLTLLLAGWKMRQTDQAGAAAGRSMMAVAPGEESRMLDLRRRDFITLLGGAVAIAWPGAARAQQPNPVRRIGVLMGIGQSDPEGQSRVTALRQGLEQSNLRDGQNVHIEYRWGAGDASQIRSYAAELVASAPDVILATNTPTVRALQQLTRTISIVFVSVSDPVSDGFVTSLSKPGGNITGFSTYEPSMAGKWVQFLKLVAPDVMRIAVIFNPETAAHSLYLPSLESTAPSFGVRIVPAPVRDPDEIQALFSSLSRERGGGLVTIPDSFTVVHRAMITRFAEQHRVPAIYTLLPFARSGGLLTYATDTVSQYRQAASYIDRILKGERPADLPVVQPTKLALVINLKTAIAIGISVPDRLLALADEVIE
jgi:putative tryptophan/tyrosine transport system substrate-binding protein